MERSIVFTAVFVIVAFATTESHFARAFTVSTTQPGPSRSCTASASFSPVPSTTLCMAEGFSTGEESSKKKKRRDSSTGSADEDDDDDEGDNKPAASAATPEELELAALKAEIGEFEKSLAAKKSALQYALDQCEEYSKTGYARKVAEMENMRRVRSSLATTSASSATASVLRNFLPIYDTLNNLKDKYADDEFGSKFGALNLNRAFTSLGATDFHVQPGEKVNNFRMKVLEKEVSTEFAADTVIREVSPGMELNGNVIRAASCVTSLGSPSDDKEAETKVKEGSDNAAE